jgi:hypothetical protein
VGALWRRYSEYPYMPRPRDRAVLDAGLTGPQLLWEQEGFALADGYDEASEKYRADMESGLSRGTSRISCLSAGNTD